MSKRYKPVGNWWTREGGDLFVWSATQSAIDSVTIEVCDALDTRGGRVYADGVHRVTVKGPPGRPRSKTFIGEMAWSSANRYAEDAITWLTKHERGELCRT